MRRTLGAGFTVWTADRAGDHDTVYSVAALDARLELAGPAWVGHTAQVRGVVEGCSALNGPPSYYLSPDPGESAASLSVDPLSLAVPHSTALQRLFQPLPLFHDLVPDTPSSLSVDEAGVFRLKLPRQREVSCGRAACYVGLVVGVTPTGRGGAVAAGSD